MNKDSRFHRRSVSFMAFFLCFCVLGVSFSGCASLRKKFTRKKEKKDKQEEFIPVLDPIDYAPRLVSAQEKYQYHYSLWKVWQEELIQDIDHKGSDKKQKYLTGQVTVQLQEMQKWLTDEKKTELAALAREFQEITQVYAEPAPMRNMFSVKKKIEANVKKIRHQFQPKDMKEFLIKP